MYRKSDGPDFALEWAHQSAGEVAGSHGVGPSQVSGKLLGQLQSEIWPGGAAFPNDFAFQRKDAGIDCIAGVQATC